MVISGHNEKRNDDIRVVISNTTVSTSVAGTAYPRLPPIMSVVRVAQSLVHCVVLCRSLCFVFLSFFT
jgi:hypothetical protein